MLKIPFDHTFWKECETILIRNYKVDGFLVTYFMHNIHLYNSVTIEHLLSTVAATSNACNRLFWCNFRKGKTNNGNQSVSPNNGHQ